MLTIALWFFKIKSIINNMIAFAIRNWRIVLPIIAILFYGYKYHAQVVQTEKANAALKKSQALVVSVTESLQETTKALENQTNQVRMLHKASQNAQEAAQKARLKAKQDNAIDAPKITAVESHINLIKTDSCDKAIEALAAKA